MDCIVVRLQWHSQPHEFSVSVVQGHYQATPSSPCPSRGLPDDGPRNSGCSAY